MTSTCLTALLLLGLGQEQPLFRASTEAVQVDVFVGKDGHAIPGLTADAFSLHDNGEARDIQLLDVTTVPLDVAIVLDTSRSVAGQKLESLRQGVHTFIDGLEDKDQAALITFSQHLSLRAASTSDRDELHTAVDAVASFGATAWHDALFAGLKTVEGSPDRPVVLLFSDGDDTYSFLLEEQLMPLITHSDAVLYAITPALPRPTTGTEYSVQRKTWLKFQEQRSRRTKMLRQLSEASGGRLIETDSIERLRDVFLELLVELKTRYLLSFQPPHPVAEGWHELDVEVNVRGAEVQARRGYFYE